MLSCRRCELAYQRSTVVIGDIAGENSLCFIGEAPGKYEDMQGRPFVGKSGKLLDQMLDRIGVGRKNVSVLNIVKCRPPNNRTPTNLEMRFCGDKWLIPQLKQLKPSMIVTLGSVALRYFFPHAKMTSSKGIPLFHDELQVTIYPMFHPSYILRSGSTLLDEYFKDFQMILKLNQYNQEKSGITTQIHQESKQSRLDEYF